MVVLDNKEMCFYIIVWLFSVFIILLVKVIIDFSEKYDIPGFLCTVNLGLCLSEMEKGGRIGRTACANFSQLC